MQWEHHTSRFKVKQIIKIWSGTFGSKYKLVFSLRCSAGWTSEKKKEESAPPPWYCHTPDFCLAWTEFSKRLCDHSCSMCMYVVICQIDHCIHIHWCIVIGLGHNDPWVESHMWPQQTWGQRSCRGQWPLVQVFGKKDQCIHVLWCIFNLILQWLQKYVLAKAGETRGWRTALYLIIRFWTLSVIKSCVCSNGNLHCPYQNNLEVQ